MNIDQQTIARLTGAGWERYEWIGASVTTRMKDELRALCAARRCSVSVVIREAVARVIIEAGQGVNHD